MIKNSCFKILIFTIILTTTLVAYGQKPINYDSPKYEFNCAMELFQKEKYGSAQQYFKYVYENTTDQQQDIKSNSYFYMGICAAELFNDDAIFLLNEFIRLYPVHSLIQEAHFYLGRYYFYKKKYKKVIESFEEIDTWNVEPSLQPEYYFKKGYAYFDREKMDEAKSALYKAETYEGEYKVKAEYYLAHIAYMEENYEIALDRFLVLAEESQYKDLAPYYIAQIYFIQNEYDSLVKAASPLFENTTGTNKIEMARLLGLAYYSLGQYSNASPYFDFYLDEKNNKNYHTIDRKDFFAAGFSYYQSEQYEKAIELLSNVTDQEDLSTQHAYYLIGDSYIKLNQLNLAKLAFLSAYRYDFEPNIKEDALYNYAKIQYETSKQPYTNAIKALEKYMQEYPNSTRSEEASSYLSKIYLTSKNYQAAITSLEKLSSKNPELLNAYQRATYFRGLELLNKKDHRNAIVMFDKSLAYSFNTTIKDNALYWKGEAQFRSGKYENAFTTLRAFAGDNKKAAEFYINANYTLGYAALKIKKYKEAIFAFTNCLEDERLDDLKMRADATARLADCYFMEKNLKKAIQYYEECEKLGSYGADYALYQRAKCYDFRGETRKKASTLKHFIQQYPNSPYLDKAIYDMATVHHNMGEYHTAIEAYHQLIIRFPKSSKVREAYNKLAQAYLNTQDEEEAIKIYKTVIEKYPGSKEAKDALANLENVYTERGSTGEFFDYVKNKKVNYSVERQDSISFKAAESKYIRGDCNAAIIGFTDYISQFPDGSFIATAHFYKAECAYTKNLYDEALPSYEAIINNYNTEYNEVALRKASYILFSKNDFARAKPYFKELSELASSENNKTYAYNGWMRCAFELGLFHETMSAANYLLESGKVDEDLRNAALYYAGKSALATLNEAKAKEYFGQLAQVSNDDEGTEAAYWCAQIEFNEGNIDNCEKAIKDIISADYRSEYWLARTFILYGDWYKTKGNNFQARHTYQSILDNFEGQELRDLAQQKLNELGDN